MYYYWSCVCLINNKYTQYNIIYTSVCNEIILTRMRHYTKINDFSPNDKTNNGNNERNNIYCIYTYTWIMYLYKI